MYDRRRRYFRVTTSLAALSWLRFRPCDLLARRQIVIYIPTMQFIAAAETAKRREGDGGGLAIYFQVFLSAHTMFPKPRYFRHICLNIPWAGRKGFLLLLFLFSVHILALVLVLWIDCRSPAARIFARNWRPYCTEIKSQYHRNNNIIMVEGLILHNVT